MTDWLSPLLVALIILFIILLVWSKFQNQRIADTLMEIKEIVQGLGAKK